MPHLSNNLLQMFQLVIIFLGSDLAEELCFLYSWIFCWLEYKEGGGFVDLHRKREEVCLIDDFVFSCMTFSFWTWAQKRAISALLSLFGENPRGVGVVSPKGKSYLPRESHPDSQGLGELRTKGFQFSPFILIFWDWFYF